MNFPYSSVIAAIPNTTEFILLRRPEIPITIVGPAGFASYVALVDTGSDNTIFPRSVADLLGISLTDSECPSAGVFGGGRVRLLEGSAKFRLETADESIEWQALACFFDFKSDDEETVILGHAGFLDYFSATFDGQMGLLTLLPNDDLPVSASDNDK